MKIKTRLRLNTFISLGVFILILLSLAWSFREMSIATRNLDQITEMRKTAFERIILRDDYLLNHEARARTQWIAKSEALRRLLESASEIFTSSYDQALLKEARGNFDFTVASFSKFMEDHEREGRAAKKGFVFNEAESRLIGQVFMKAYALTDSLNRLYESAFKTRTTAWDRGLLAVIVSVIGGILASIINTVLTSRILAKRIVALGKGLEIIGAGDLDYRIVAEGDDELTDLALAGNQMAVKLGLSYTAITDLEKEFERRKLAEEALQESERRLIEAQKMAQLGNWSWDVRSGVVEWSEEVYNIFHLNPKEFTPQIDSILAMSPWPEDHERDKELIRKAMESHEKGNYEQRFLRPDGSTGYYCSTFQGKYDDDGNLISIVGTVLDITERKSAEEQLQRTLAELERSNKELEQFAYVASHDLQEPLRMVSSYTQLLAQRYEGQLDDKARKFIDYAVDGAVRMQRLINDLLAYSRVNTQGKNYETVDSHAVLGEALRNLSATIEENRAIVMNDDLPMVRADATQLSQLFQNLVGNAIKFRGAELPRIQISARDLGREWRFSVNDNGIGIDARYADKVFVIFQRLHTRQEYSGTGIGLAICKRIVERHEGRIWFESEPGKGSTFYFTLPK